MAAAGPSLRDRDSKCLHSEWKSLLHSDIVELGTEQGFPQARLPAMQARHALYHCVTSISTYLRQGLVELPRVA